MVMGNITDRIEFLAKKFDVFECAEAKQIKAKFDTLTDYGFKPKLIDHNHKPLAIYSVREHPTNKERQMKNVSVSFDVFSAMIAADPTPNKSCVQWMLNTFTRYIRDNKNQDIAAAVRFVTEDLPQANSFLTLFEANKRKNKFKELANTSYILKNVKDPTDINQYKSLSHLFDAVDPFIPKDPSTIERLLNRFVDSGQAIIPVKDRKFTLYIPKTRNASVVFGSFSAWCTAIEGNGNFESYTNQFKPNGKKSDIYIIIDNRFFTGESMNIYQIHFESNQVMDRSNQHMETFYEDVINKSEGLANFFYEELMGMAKSCSTGLNDNKYLDFLIKFGFSESLFELIDASTPTIKIMKRELPRMSDLSRFKTLDQLIIADAKLVEIHPSIGKLSNLEMVSLPNNRIKSLPKELGSLKNLKFLNIKGNKIQNIPEELKYLDVTNGGSLWRLVTCEDDIGKENYQKLKELLPSVMFELNDKVSV